MRARVRQTGLVLAVAVGLVGSLGAVASATALDGYGLNEFGWNISVSNKSDFDFLYLGDDSWNIAGGARGIVSGESDNTVKGYDYDTWADNGGPMNVTVSYDSVELAAGWVRFIDVKDTEQGTARVACGVRNDDDAVPTGCTVDNRLSDGQPNVVRSDEPVQVTFTSLGEGPWSRNENVKDPFWLKHYDYGIHHEGWRVEVTNGSSRDLFSAGGTHVYHSPQGIARGEAEISLGREHRSRIVKGDIPRNAHFDFDSLDLKPGWKRYVDVSTPGGGHHPDVSISCGLLSPSGEILVGQGCAGLAFDWEKPISVTFTDPGIGSWSP